MTDQREVALLEVLQADDWARAFFREHGQRFWLFTEMRPRDDRASWIEYCWILGGVELTKYQLDALVDHTQIERFAEELRAGLEAIDREEG